MMPPVYPGAELASTGVRREMPRPVSSTATRDRGDAKAAPSGLPPELGEVLEGLVEALRSS